MKASDAGAAGGHGSKAFLPALPVSELENLLQALKTARAIDVTQDTLKEWSGALESCVKTVKEEQRKAKQHCKQSAAPPPGAGAGSGGAGKAFTFPTVIDKNKKEPRQLVHAVSQAAYQKTRNCGICIVAVLESVLNQVQCDVVSLSVPYRGHEDEFRCMCALSRTRHDIITGCGIIRGVDTLEYAAHSTGYVVATCPKAMLLVEDSQSEECVSLMELMADPARRQSKVRSVARLCCPVKTSSRRTIAALTVTHEGNSTFSKEAENFLFDAATIIGTILSRCNDYTTLQACFAKGDLRDELQPLPTKLIDIPDPRTQLVYRISHNPNEPASSIRVVNALGRAEKLREGTPLRTVYDHMERLQHSWFAAVRLNVELKRKCDEQDRCLAVLLSRSRAASAAAAALGSGGGSGGGGVSGGASTSETVHPEAGQIPTPENELVNDAEGTTATEERKASLPSGAAVSEKGEKEENQKKKASMDNGTAAATALSEEEGAEAKKA